MTIRSWTVWLVFVAPLFGDNRALTSLDPAARETAVSSMEWIDRLWMRESA